MNCPKCEHKQTCPCASCQSRNPSKYPWVWNVDQENIACGLCGMGMHANDWLALSMEGLSNRYWLEIDLETKLPTGKACSAYYGESDKPSVGNWIMVKKVTT